MVSDQLDQYIQFVKDMILKEVSRESLLHAAFYVNQNLPYHSGFGQMNADNMIFIAYTVGLCYLKSVRYHWRLVPCYTRAGRICFTDPVYELPTLEPHS